MKMASDLPAAAAIAEAVPCAPGRRLRAMLERSWRAWAQWRERRRAIRYLSALGDRQLKDIGISRSQIEPAVMGVRDR